MKHDNVIGLLDAFTPDSSFRIFNDIYFVTSLMQADLSQVLKTEKLSEEHVKFLVYQILRGLKYIHSAGIIHRDLKPSNLAVNEQCELKIIDFGLARRIEPEMSSYVITRWYRAPDIVLNWRHYDQAVDIWSVGCILAEMLTGKVLFPGKDTLDQVVKVLNVCGPPDDEFMSKITDPNVKEFLLSYKVNQTLNIQDILKGASESAIDMVEQMLKLDPICRPTAEFALTHPFVQEYADPDDEPTCDDLFDDSFIERNLSLDQWKKLIWNEIFSSE